MSPFADAFAAPWLIGEPIDCERAARFTRHDDCWLARLCAPRVGLPVMLFVLLAILPWSVYRAEADNGCDFADFTRGGAYVLEHGCRHPCTALNRYLPSVDVACAGLTLLPASCASIVYYLANVTTWFALLAIVRYGLLSSGLPISNDRAVMAAGLLTLVIAIDGFLVGAFHLLMLFLMVAGLVQASRDRSWRGGTLLGLAVWLKLLPIVGVGYLLLRRKWQPALIALLVACAVDITLSIGAFGGRQAWREHVTWAHGGVVATVEEQMHGHDEGDADRITNQSTTVLLRRFLTVRGGYTALALADLSSAALSLVTGCVLGALVVVPVLVLRQGAAHSPVEWGAEIALVVLLTTWLSPVVWSYHLTAALPALAVIMAHNDSETRKQAVALAWLAAMALFAWPLARAAGHMLWASLYLGSQLIATLRNHRGIVSAAPRLATRRGSSTQHSQLPSGGFATSGSSGL